MDLTLTSCQFLLFHTKGAVIKWLQYSQQNISLLFQYTSKYQSEKLQTVYIAMYSDAVPSFMAGRSVKLSLPFLSMSSVKFGFIELLKTTVSLFSYNMALQLCTKTIRAFIRSCTYTGISKIRSLGNLAVSLTGLEENLKSNKKKMEKQIQKKTNKRDVDRKLKLYRNLTEQN